MKFLDPHEKIVIELKDEIRRLRHENQKLRSNIASAPAATGGEKSTSKIMTTPFSIWLKLTTAIAINRRWEICWERWW